MESWNVIYIHTHDSGNVFSPYGYKVPTAAIEEFAGDAAMFRSAFCAAPTCSPSRAALLSGRYPHSAGMLGLTNRGFKMTDYRTHLVHLLKEHGYHTALCGIQHEAAHFAKPEDGARIIGYDENITTPTYLKSLTDRRVWDQENTDRACQWLMQRKTNAREEEVGQEEVGQVKAESMEGADSDQPFFLSMGFFCTHRPYPPVQSETTRFIRPPAGYPDEPELRADFAGHCEALESVDTCFAQLIETLKATGYYENSIIIFTTDHGIAYPFGKSTLYDSGLAVALFMRVPGSAANGQQIEHLVSQVDMVPTLCELLNLPCAEDYEGLSFADYLLEPETAAPKRDAVYAEMNFHTSYEPARCIRTRRYKYIEYLDRHYDGQNLSNVNESGAKDWYLQQGLRDRKKPWQALYDLTFDPDERNNCIDDPAYQKIAGQLALRLMTWRRETNDPLLDPTFIWNKDWIINKTSCEVQGSTNPDDLIRL